METLLPMREPPRSVVYHFTDVLRLPWILRSGELRCGANRIGGFPDPDFLWATTDSKGHKRWATGRHPARFVLSAEDFEPWHKIVRRFPQWTTHHIRRLERMSRGDDPRQWRCRQEPLPRDRWLGIETFSPNGVWKPLSPDTSVLAADVDGFSGLTIEVDGSAYFSAQVAGAAGAVAYIGCRQ
jgi:hypothetical protein